MCSWNIYFQLLNFSLLPEQIWKPLTELSQFIRDLCSTSVGEDDLIRWMYSFERYLFAQM